MGNKLVSLKKRTEFLELKDQGKFVKACPWMMISYKTNLNKGLRCGWTIPKKYAGAVSRNKLKRWCREFFRSKISDNFDVDLNVIFRAKDKGFFKKLDHGEFLQQMEKTWSRCIKSI